MKTFLPALCLCLFLAAPSLAATGYVSDILVVTVRAQPGKNKTILTTVQTGNRLEIIEEQKGFMLIRTEKGIEGYVRSQYITKDLPKAEKIKQLLTENRKLQQQIDQLSASLSNSKKKTQSLTSTEKELALVNENYQKLQKISSGAVQITLERDQLQKENSDLAERLQQLKEENNLYLRTGVIKWFLAGAGVLFFGWLLGKVSRKKKRSYL